MRVIWATQSVPNNGTANSIFLAGPTPRKKDVKSWRPEALKILKGLGFDGLVFVPEDETGKWKHSYIDQVEWEEKHLNLARCILFWIPRKLPEMPAFTTNIEWGIWYRSKKVVLGIPDDAVKVSYIKHGAEKEKVPFANTLEGTLRLALDEIKRIRTTPPAPFVIDMDDPRNECASCQHERSGCQYHDSDEWLREHCSYCGVPYQKVEGCRLCAQCGLTGPDILPDS